MYQIVISAGLILLLFYVAVMAAGVKMVWRGLQWRRTGDLPHCGVCDYLLIGIQSGRCPECGTIADIVHGERHRDPSMAFRGSALFVVALFLLLVVSPVAVPKFAGRTIDSQATAAKTDISNLKLALDAFDIDSARYPTTGEGLNALILPPPGLTTWTHAYIDQIPLDPWGNAYVYRRPSARAGRDYDLFSCGPDAIAGTADDISN